MSLQTKSVTIDDVEFQTTQFPALHSLEVLAKLIKVAGPALAALGNADQNAEVSSMGPQLMSALQGMKPSEARELVLDLLASTSAVMRGPTGQLRLTSLSTQDNINLVFSGKLKVMFQVVGHAIRTNFGDFTDGIDPSDPSTQLTSNE